MLVFMVNIFIQHFQKIFQTITCSFRCVCPRPTKPVRWKLKIMFSKFATPEAREELRSLAARLVLQESPLQSLDIHPTCQAFSSLTIAVLAEPTKSGQKSHDTLMHTFRGPAVFPTWWLSLRRAYEWLWCRRHSAPPPTGQMSRQSVAPCLNGSPHLRIEPREQIIGMNRVSVRQKQTLFLMQHDKTKMDMRICSYTFR